MRFDLHNLALVGRGAHGSVWLVHDRAHGRFLALKIVRFKSWDDAREALARVRSLASGAPGHWHVVWVDFGLGSEAPAEVSQAFPREIEGPFVYVIMPHLHGPSAAELAKADGRFGWAEALALGAQVAQKLARRPQGEAHLDVKPENVLVDRQSGEAFLVDAHWGGKAGTPGYSAPEQRAPGSAPGPAADLYSLGATLRRLVARDVGESLHSEVLPVWPEIPADWPPAKRRAVADFEELVDGTLLNPEPAGRGEAAAAAKQLLALSAAVSGPDLASLLVEAMARASLDRVSREAEIMKAAGADLPSPATRVRGPRSRLLLLLLGVLAALIPLGLGLRHHFSSARPVVPPPTAAWDSDGPAFDPAVHHTGFAVRLHPGEKADPTRGILQIQLNFPTQGLAVLDRHQLVADRIELPQAGQIYAWDVRPGTVGYEIDRSGYGPDRQQLAVEPKGRQLVKPEADLDFAPHGGEVPDAWAAQKKDPRKHFATDEILESVKPGTIVREGPLFLSAVWWEGSGHLGVSTREAACKQDWPEPGGSLILDKDHLLCAWPSKSNPAEALKIHLEGLLP